MACSSRDGPNPDRHTMCPADPARAPAIGRSNPETMERMRVAVKENGAQGASDRHVEAIAGRLIGAAILWRPAARIMHRPEGDDRGTS